MMSLKYYFVFFIILMYTFDILDALVRNENSESNFARNLNGKKPNNGTSKQHSLKKSLFRLTALKIVMFILTVILSGVFIYYFFLFYPILCRKERNYDVVEQSRDTTPTPNTEKI